MHSSTQYIFYSMSYEYPDIHEGPYMELFNLMINISQRNIYF